MTTIVGIKQLHKDMSRIARRVKKGERVLVMKHAEPLFILAPYTTAKTLVRRAPTYRLADLRQLQGKGGDKNISKKIDAIVYGI